MGKFLTLVCFFTLVFFSLYAQNQESQPEWYNGKPILEITFKGLHNVSESELQSITDDFIGKEYSDTVLWDLWSKLYALDYFEQFSSKNLPADAKIPTGDAQPGVIIEFVVKERPLISEIKIKGNKRVHKGEILDVIVLKVGDVINKTKLQADEEAVKNLYLEKGFLDITVSASYATDEKENKALVTFDINEGSQTKIKKIYFSGNNFASAGTLKGLMKTKEQSLFSSGTFDESKLQDDINKIERYYWDRGYIDAKVIDVKKEVERDEKQNKNNLNLTIYIQEGEQYTYGGLTLKGNVLYSEAEIKAKLKLKPGAIFNYSRFEQDYSQIQALYADFGYIFNRYEKKEQRDEENKTVSYTIDITEGPVAHIENIVITGNEKTKDSVISREIPFEEGDVFSRKKFMQSMQNLMNLQYFDNVVPEPTQGSAEGLMDIVYNIEEGRTMQLNFGVTLSGAEVGFPLIAFLKWTDKNFLGLGYNISAGTELSTSKQSLNFSFADNWLFNQRWSWGLDFTTDHTQVSGVYQDLLSPVFPDGDPNAVPDPFTGKLVDPATGLPSTASNAITDYEYAMLNQLYPNESYLMSYDSFNFTLGGSTGYTWVTNIGRLKAATRLSTNLKYVDYDESLFRPYDEEIRHNLKTWKFINKWLTDYSWDTRDIIANPSSGFFLNQRFTLTGGFLGGERDYIKSNTRGEIYYKLLDLTWNEDMNFRLILAGLSSFAMILPQFGQTDDNATREDLLYIDGMNIARGWDRVYDGRVLWDSAVELRTPVVENVLWWDTFLSGTVLYNKRSSLNSMNIDDFLFSTGTGLRLSIPGLPLGFFLVRRFQFEKGQARWIDETYNLFGFKPVITISGFFFN